MTWTDEADNMLVTLWAQGVTMAGIAQQLTAAGYPCKRSAIAGRKRRLALRGHEFEERETPAVFQKERFINPPSTVAPPADTGYVTHSQGVDYTALSSKGCKAILDDRGSDGLWKCCGKLRQDGSSYCAEHTKRYFNPNYQRRAQQDGQSSKIY